MTNLAAAVEQVRKDVQEAKDSSIVPHLVLTHIDHLETILAELDRLSRPSAPVELSEDECWELCSRLSEITPMPYKPSSDVVTRVVNQWLADTRPPVAGLAELTDVKLVALYSELRHTSKEFCGLPHPMENWAEAHDAAIAKAAREFLGKVDG